VSRLTIDRRGVARGDFICAKAAAEIMGLHYKTFLYRWHHWAWNKFPQPIHVGVHLWSRSVVERFKTKLSHNGKA